MKELATFRWIFGSAAAVETACISIGHYKNEFDFPFTFPRGKKV
jgi:hypothetical protein